MDKTFLPDKPSSKRCQAMKANLKQMVGSPNSKLVQVSIDLPYPILLEQIVLHVEQPNPKKQSDYSQSYALISCHSASNNSELALKSAYSELVTRTGRLEYNVTGVVTERLTLTFAKSDSPAVPKDKKFALSQRLDQQSDDDDQAISTEQIQIQIQQQAADIDLEDRVLAGGGQSILQGICADDTDDYRILESLPQNQRGASSVQNQQTVEKLEPQLGKLLKSFEVIGFNMTLVPAITNLTYFMNQQFFLQSKGKNQEAHEVEFMTGQLLVTTKRSTQAAELYRKMQISELNMIQSGQKSVIKFKRLIQCAVFELLIADSMSPSAQVNEKILSIQRLCTFLKGEVPRDVQQRFAPQIEISKADSFSSLLLVLPDTLRFTIACLSHRMEIVRISALKMLKYILETIGCSLDYGMVFILKAMLKTYPVEGQRWQIQDEEFDLKKLIGIDMTIIEYLYEVKSKKSATPSSTTACHEPCKWQSIEEPQSGSKRAMINIYNHVLDTFISVLSSVSSHILHAIFYDVIESTLVPDNSYPIEVRVFTCKIADKIFTICQGDLILTPKLMDTLLSLTSNLKAQAPESIEHTAQQQVKSLWLSIRNKVLPNYSNKGFQSLVNWLVQKLTEIKGQEGQDDRVRQMAEVITIVSLGRQKSEEDANQLIRLPSFEQYGGGPSSELYLVLSPLLYWLEYSIDREDRLPLFMQLYQTVKDVLAGLPKGQSELDIVSVIFPSLRRCSEFLADNSPSLSMIKFLDIVLSDMLRNYQKNQRTQAPLDIQQFFLELLQNFVVYVPYSLYEEVLFVFEKLIALCCDVISEKVLQSCIIALVDKYTAKSKQLKSTLQTFMKFLLNSNNFQQKSKQQSPNSQRSEAIEDMLSEGGGMEQQITNRQNYFDMMAEFCFFNNHFGPHAKKNKPQPHHAALYKQLEFRSPQDLHDLNIEKLQFFIDSLQLMTELHIAVFTNLITHPQFRNNLLLLIDSGESQVRLKAHEIMESLTQYFVQYCPSKTVYEFTNGTNQNDTMDAEYISHERLYISQIVISVVKMSLERSQTDCYLQFNSLILLDFLFQNLLPVPTFQNELLKSQRQQRRAVESQSDNTMEDVTLDVEILSISETTPEMDVMEPAYLRMRMKLVFSMWPHVQAALNSPWSNIRSICYGLICSMLRIDINDYPKEPPATQQHRETSPGAQTRQQQLSNNLSFDETEIQVSQSGLTNLVLPMLHSLLSSKESESKAGGLNILGSFCGLSYDFTSVRVNKHLAFFQRNSAFVSNQVWKLVWSLQDDWDITIKEASVVLIQLCAPRAAILYFESRKQSKELSKIEYLQKMKKVSDVYCSQKDSSSFNTREQECPVRSEYARRAMALFPSIEDCMNVLHLRGHGQDQFSADDSNYSMSVENGVLGQGSHEPITFEQFMFSRETSFPPEALHAQQILQLSDELAQVIHEFNPEFEDKRFSGNGQQMSRRRQLEMEIGMPKSAENSNFFVDAYSDDQIQEIISIFRNDFKPPKNLWIEKQPVHGQTSQQSGYGNPPQSQSPDFYQDIFSDAIDQFNRHQMMMQQKQQDELQQQVSTGLNTSQSSISSTESLTAIVPLKPQGQQLSSGSQENEHSNSYNDSQNSSTPSPVQQDARDASPPQKPGLTKKAPVLSQFNQGVLPTAGPGAPWPTSPVLVSNKDKAAFKPSEQTEGENAAKRQEQFSDREEDEEEYEDDFHPTNVNIAQNANAAQNDNSEERKEQPAKRSVKPASEEPDDLQQVPKRAKAKQPHLNKSEPDFSLINLKNSPKGTAQHKRREARDDQNSGSLMMSPGGSSTNASDPQQKISRKTAQTYLSNLNQPGYIQNMDNMKLINTCLSQQQIQHKDQQQPASPNSILNLQLSSGSQPTQTQKKLSIKTVNSPSSNGGSHNDSALMYLSQHKGAGTQSTKHKKQTISNSPETAGQQSSQTRGASGGHGKTSRPSTHKKGTAFAQKQFNTKQTNNLADLNFFIKSLEKGMSSTTTPSNLIKKVEDQMKAMGVKQNHVNDQFQQERKGSTEKTRGHPHMKPLSLNNIAMKSDDQLTPHSSEAVKRVNAKNSASPKRLAGRSHDSDSDFYKTSKMADKKQSNLQNSVQEKLSARQRESESRERDNKSSGRGGQGSYSILNQPAILTERSSQNGQHLNGLKNQVPGKQSNSTRYDSAGLFQFKKGNSKSQQKGYSALAGKSILSPSLMKAREHQQSGSGLINQSKLNLSRDQIQTQGKASSTHKKQGASNHKLNQSMKSGAAAHEGAEKGCFREQGGDRGKVALSPDSATGGGSTRNQAKKKKSGHSHNNSSGVGAQQQQRPALVLQQMQYF